MPRRDTYKVHLNLPEWMREAIAQSARRRRWSINTYIEAATENLLKEDGFPPPPDEQRPPGA